MPRAGLLTFIAGPFPLSATHHPNPHVPSASRQNLETPSFIVPSRRQPPSKEEISQSSQRPDDRLAQFLNSKQITSRSNPVEKKQTKKTKISTPSTEKLILSHPDADNSLEPSLCCYLSTSHQHAVYTLSQCPSASDQFAHIAYTSPELSTVKVEQTTANLARAAPVRYLGPPSTILRCVYRISSRICAASRVLKTGASFPHLIASSFPALFSHGHIPRVLQRILEQLLRNREILSPPPNRALPKRAPPAVPPDPDGRT